MRSQVAASVALAGGVNLTLSPHTNIALSKAHMLSPDGRCKTFDQRANGYVRSEGCGLVLLKPLEDALRDGDQVLSVIKGLAEDGMTMLLVTHEMRFAFEVSDKIVFMNQGRIEEQGPPKELFERPQSPRLAEFLKNTRF